MKHQTIVLTLMAVCLMLAPFREARPQARRAEVASKRFELKSEPELKRKAWRIQSPCDRSFSVVVPARLYEVSWFEGKHGPSIEPEEGFERDGRAFVALQGAPKKRQFGVVVQNVLREDRHALERRDFGGLYFVIGGDDATPTSEKAVYVNGLNGREYVYAKAISEDTYTRGRIFYAGGRIYIIVFVATSAEDLSSQDADRFLNSFRLRG